MDTHFYYAPGLDIERMAFDLEGMFIAQGYQAQHFGNKKQVVVQFKQGSDFEALIGMQAALTLTLSSFPEGVAATVGQQQWVDKAVVGAIGMFLFWPLMVTTGAGVIRQSQLESQLLSNVDLVARQQKPGVQPGPVPPHILSYMQQGQQTPPPFQSPFQQAQQTPPPYYQQPWNAPGARPVEAPCPNCKAMNEVGDAYCSHCGKSLAPQKRVCPECKSEVKPGADFCAKCGTSVSQPQ